MSATPIRLLIADGHPIVLEGLRSVLGHLPALQVVGEASDGMEAIEKTVSLDPDVVLMESQVTTRGRFDGASEYSGARRPVEGHPVLFIGK